MTLPHCSECAALREALSNIEGGYCPHEPACPVDEDDALCLHKTARAALSSSAGRGPIEAMEKAREALEAALPGAGSQGDQEPPYWVERARAALSALEPYLPEVKK